MACLMILSTVIVTISANASTEILADVGYRDDRVTKADLNGVPNILDFPIAQEDRYQITNSEGMVAFSQLVNISFTFSGMTVYLAEDINMAGIEMMPIGIRDFGFDNEGTIVTNRERAFEGVFDGQGHFIQGLVMNYDIEQVQSVGLFGNLAGTVKNLKLDSTCSITWTNENQSPFGDYASAGVIAAYSAGVGFWNIYSEASLTSAGHGASEEKTNGCGGTVIGGFAVIMLVSGAAITLMKKKED